VKRQKNRASRVGEPAAKTDYSEKQHLHGMDSLSSTTMASRKAEVKMADNLSYSGKLHDDNELIQEAQDLA